jgi:hypothetical protein
MAPPVLEQDLNALPLLEDPQEVLIHPVGQNQAEEQLHFIPQPFVQPDPENLEGVADNINPLLDVQLPVLQVPGENFLHLEIPEEDLMNLEEGNQGVMEIDEPNPPHLPQGQDQNMEEEVPFFQNNLQIGMVRTYFAEPSGLPKQNPYWFTPVSNEKDSLKEKAVVKLPTQWLDFFQSLLLTPAQNNWARKLLGTNFPNLLQGETDWITTISVTCKPSPDKACALLDSELSGPKELENAVQDEELEEVEEISPIRKKSRKGKSETPIVDSLVRRSTRVRTSCNGFKTPNCKSKNCLGCSSEIPTLSPATLRKIGMSMCDLSEEQLGEAMLMGKKNLDPIGKKIKKNKEEKKKKKKKDDKEDNEDKN